MMRRNRRHFSGLLPQTDGALLIISYEEISSHNGLNTRIRGIARALSEAGRQVDIAAPCYGSQTSPPPPEFDGIRIHTIPVPSVFARWRIPILTRMLSVAPLTAQVVRHLRKSQDCFAWVQTEHAYPFLASYILAKKWGARVILGDPSLLGRFVEEKLRNRRLMRAILKRAIEAFETALWRRADCILCSSQRTAGEIARRTRGAKTRVHRVGNGVDLNEFTIGPVGGPGNRIFFNCSVPYYQNIAALQNLLKIFEHFDKEGFHNYTATVVVNDAAALPLEVALQIRLNPKVRLLCNQSSLVPLLHESDLVLLPYEKGHLTTAGPRLKVFEALACGKIVLGTPEGLDEIPGCIHGRNVLLCSDWLDMARKTMDLSSWRITHGNRRVTRELAGVSGIVHRGASPTTVVLDARSGSDVLTPLMSVQSTDGLWHPIHSELRGIERSIFLAALNSSSRENLEAFASGDESRFIDVVPILTFLWFAGGQQCWHRDSDHASVVRQLPADRSKAQIALDLFLDNQVLFFEHHTLFRDGTGAFNRTAEMVNTLQPAVQWASLGTIARHLYLERDGPDGGREVRMFCRSIDLVNDREQEQTCSVEKEETSDVPIRRVLVNGAAYPYVVSQGRLQLSVAIKPHQSCQVEVQYEDNFQASQADLSKNDRRINRLRALSDLRDRTVYRHKSLRWTVDAYYATGLYRLGLMKTAILFGVFAVVLATGSWRLLRQMHRAASRRRTDPLSVKQE